MPDAVDANASDCQDNNKAMQTAGQYDAHSEADRVASVVEHCEDGGHRYHGSSGASM